MNNRCFDFFPSRLPSNRDLKVASYVTLGTISYLINFALAADRGCEQLIAMIENREFATYFFMGIEELAPDEGDIASDLQKAGICNDNGIMNCNALSKNKEYRGYLPSLFERGICRSEASNYYSEMETQRKAMQQSSPTVEQTLTQIGGAIVWTVFLVVICNLLLPRDRNRALPRLGSSN